MATFGQRLRKIRTDNNLTQKDFGVLFKLSESAIGMYERDEREPPFKFANDIADRFDVDTDYLFGRTDIPKSRTVNSKNQTEFEAFINNPEHGIFFRDYLSAPEERREEMREIFKILQEKEKGRKPGDIQGEDR
ncbi:helix-turn-helix transcriptional regulator [Paenibacillus sp. FSL P4-0338]|uniref:helix-turn-helix domain-containing protein n=1 Tax=Paenibacillus sp. FSL P4-0338 TaxID=2921635 RepID=UPI0030F6BC88